MFKKKAADVAEEYGGEAAGDMVEAAIDQVAAAPENQAGGASGGDDLVSGLVQSFTGKQEGGLSSLFSMIGGSQEGLQSKAESKGLDPALISGLMSMLGGGGDGGASSGGGFDLNKLMSCAAMLTKGGSGGGSGGGGAEGFMGLLGGSGNSGNIMGMLTGLAKSFFNMQRGKNPSAQSWNAASPDGASGGGFSSWAMAMVRDLLFPGKKAKEVIEEGKDDDSGDKDADKGGIKGWYDGHPEIGKMQKDIFDDVLDIGDDDENDGTNDDAPLIPAPIGFEDDCSVLEEAMVLYLNTHILLELRKSWRFLYSTKKHERDFRTFKEAVQFKGPTLLVIKTSEGQVAGAYASTSWTDTDGGWTGDSDTYLFTLAPKMAIFYSTGKNDNVMYMDDTAGLGLGGRKGHFGLGLDASLQSATYNEDVDTFDLPANVLPGGGEPFSVAHVEVWGLGPEPSADAERSKTSVRKPNLEISGGGQVDMGDLLGQIS